MQSLPPIGRANVRRVTSGLSGVSTAVVVTALLSVASPATAATIPITGDPVLYWAELLSDSQVGSPVPGSRGIAMVTVAIHDAVNATQGNTQVSYLKGLNTPGGNTRAAASQAAHDLLVQLFPARAADFGNALAQQLAQVPDGAAKARGIETGRTIAAAMAAQRAGDRFDAVIPYTPSGQPGRYAFTPGVTSAAFAQWGNVEPWLLNSGDQFRPGAPPALTSAEYTAAFNEVKEIGSATSTTRTDDQTAAARFWASNVGSPMLRLAIALAQEKGLSTQDNARMLALFSTVVADSAIATWDAKYFYDFWRPITGIRGADTDGNPDTIADPGWSPLIADPPYPAYTSGFGAVAGSGALVLQDIFGNDFGFCSPHPVQGTPERCFDNFDDLLNEIEMNRLWAGIHWRFDMSEALALARNVKQFAFASDAFDAVPEPGVIGLFGLGALSLMAAARRRKRPIAR